MANIVSTRSLREQMTGKERLEAALRLDEVDRIPWAPKVFIGHYRSGTSSAHQSMSIAEFASVLHCDAIAWDSLVKARSTNVTQEIVRDGLVTSRITTTPVGEIVSASTRSPDTHSSHPTEFPLKSPSDYEVAKYIAEHTTFEPAAGVHEQALASVGDRGIVVTTGPGTPLMTMIQNTVGMPHIYFHMADHRQEFDELFEAEAANWLRHYEAIAQTDADYVCVQENTSTTLVSPALYERYCLPLKQKACEIVRRAGEHCMLHMCGRLEGLMASIREVGADSWESFTPPPIGDTYFSDGRQAAGEDVCLIGGMNAATVSVWPHEEVVSYVDDTIDGLPHTRGIVFTSGGAMPLECPTEKLAALGQKLVPHLENVK